MIRIIIIKCGKHKMWYSNKIGKTFKALSKIHINPDKSKWYIVPKCPDTFTDPMGVRVEHCRIYNPVVDGEFNTHNA